MQRQVRVRVFSFMSGLSSVRTRSLERSSNQAATPTQRNHPVNRPLQTTNASESSPRKARKKKREKVHAIVVCFGGGWITAGTRTPLPVTIGILFSRAISFKATRSLPWRRGGMKRRAGVGRGGAPDSPHTCFPLGMCNHGIHNASFVEAVRHHVYS